MRAVLIGGPIVRNVAEANLTVGSFLVTHSRELAMSISKSYGISDLQQSNINSFVANPLSGSVSRSAPKRRLDIRRDCVVVVDWGSIVTRRGSSASVISTPDRNDLRIACKDNKQVADLVESYWAASDDDDRAGTRLWSWSEKLRKDTGLTRSQAKRLMEDSADQKQACFDAIKNIIDKTNPSDSNWEW